MVEALLFRLRADISRHRHEARVASRVPLDKSEGHPKAFFGIKARPLAFLR
jgi:hypothetical protein